MIDNETTQILRENMGENTAPETKVENNSKLDTAEMKTDEESQQKTNDGLPKCAYAAGGFAGGVLASVAAQALATESDEMPVEEEKLEEAVTPQEDEEASDTTDKEPAVINPEDSPTEQEVIIATDEGIRVAQVDDNVSFSQAFADARAQVGAGGVFEWHGKLYGTFYKDEWCQMSKEERAAWQSKVDYNDVRDNTQDYHSAAHTHQPSDNVEVQTISSDAQMEDNTPAEGEIKVLGVQMVEDDNGHPMTLVGLEAPGGDQALLVDLDNDGSIDVFVHDDNGNNQIDGSEIHDVSGLNIEVDDLAQKWAEQNGMDYYSNNDGMPDYSNDADLGSFT